MNEKKLLSLIKKLLIKIMAILIILLMKLYFLIIKDILYGILSKMKLCDLKLSQKKIWRREN